MLRANGNYLYPVTALTVVRMVAGTAALLAVAAVLALAVGAVLRRSAVAVTVVIVAIVLPYLVAVTNVLSPGADDWLLRLTPAAGFAIQQAIPNYPQVSNACSRVGRLLPAGPLGRVRGAVRLGRGRPGPGGVPAAPEGRMSSGGAARRVDQAAHRPGDHLAAAGRDRGDRGGQRRGRGRRPVPGGRLRPGSRPRSASPGSTSARRSVAILAVLAVSAEYSTGMIRITLAAMPRRVTVLAAKAAVVTALILAAGAVAVAGSLLAGWLILPGHGFTRRTGSRR